VAAADVEAIKPFVSRQVWAMVRLQTLAGMRSGEVVAMRTRDLDTTGAVWSYRPASHKTEHHDKERIVPFGPQAQAVLKEWLRPDEPDRFLFSPADAAAERNAAKRAARKTRVQPSQADRRKARPKKKPGERYTPNSYRHAIQSACDRAGIDRWFPHQLRHLAATQIRRQHGLEAARVVLGHSSAAVTTLYAEMDRDKAAEIMAQVG
jgi:integrase